MKKYAMLMCLAVSAISANEVMASCNANMVLQKPDSIYSDNEDGTVTDNVTGLMWQQCVPGLSGDGCSTGTVSTYSWANALAAVQAANADAGTLGYTDWRLPNKKELASLVDKACDSPALNATLFPATPFGAQYWTSTPSVNNGSQAWAIDFTSGADAAAGKRGTFYIRLVRDAY